MDFIAIINAAGFGAQLLIATTAIEDLDKGTPKTVLAAFICLALTSHALIGFVVKRLLEDLKEARFAFAKTLKEIQDDYEKRRAQSAERSDKMLHAVMAAANGRKAGQSMEETKPI